MCVVGRMMRVDVVSLCVCVCERVRGGGDCVEGISDGFLFHCPRLFFVVRFFFHTAFTGEH